jgi:hypothetical protein
MPYLYLATIGQRPQAVTVAFDILRERYAYTQMGLLHTDPDHSGIATALRDLHADLTVAYPTLPINNHEIRDISGQPLLAYPTARCQYVSKP